MTHRNDIPRGGRAAFTLIELLIVIVVIGVLIAIGTVVSTRVVHGHKVKYTEQIMRNVMAAVEQFALEDPLRTTYNDERRPMSGKTFGPFPPYQVAAVNPGPPWYVANVLDPERSMIGDLANRLARDLNVPLTQIAIQGGNNADDIRALYTYIRAFSPGALDQVPQDAMKPLSMNVEYVDPSTSPDTQGSTRVPVLGFVDAWNVPFDYFLYAKMEYQTGADGLPRWRVTDRVPVLRSRGVRDSVVAQGNDTQSDWIFSAPFPTPAANRANADFWRTGVLNATTSAANGWARAIGQFDLNTGGQPTDPHSFGYVP